MKIKEQVHFDKKDNKIIVEKPMTIKVSQIEQKNYEKVNMA